jgi:hypothetical protein
VTAFTGWVSFLLLGFISSLPNLFGLTFVIDGGGGFQFDGWDSFRAYQLVWTKGFCVVSVGGGGVVFVKEK